MSIDKPDYVRVTTLQFFTDTKYAEVVKILGALGVETYLLDDGTLVANRTSLGGQLRLVADALSKTAE